jgi:hypothetical protein
LFWIVHRLLGLHVLAFGKQPIGPWPARACGAIGRRMPMLPNARGLGKITTELKPAHETFLFRLICCGEESVAAR